MRSTASALILGLGLAAQPGCQTVASKDMKARAAVRAEQCSRVENRRDDCEDQVGCYWDHAVGKCEAH